MEPIPFPPSHRLVGNVGEIDPECPIGSLLRLADLYGE
jgi:hypothetical protein